MDKGKEKKQKRYDLEGRLIDFSVRIISLVEKLPRSYLMQAFILRISWSDVVPHQRRTMVKHKAPNPEVILFIK